MKKQTIFLYAAFVGLIGVVILLFFPYPEVETATEVGQQEQLPPNSDNQSMNPQYGDLTQEQIQVADRAIMDLLNSGEGLNPSMVTVQSVEQQEFSDASLGCPQPDQMYAQVVTPGYKVMLEAQGQTYDYRLDTGETVIRCDQ